MRESLGKQFTTIVSSSDAKEVWDELDAVRAEFTQVQQERDEMASQAETAAEVNRELDTKLDAVRAELAQERVLSQARHDNLIRVIAERDALLTAAKDVVAQRFGSATAKECGALDSLKRAIQAAERKVKL